MHTHIFTRCNYLHVLQLNVNIYIYTHSLILIKFPSQSSSRASSKAINCWQYKAALPGKSLNFTTRQTFDHWGPLSPSWSSPKGSSWCVLASGRATFLPGPGVSLCSGNFQLRQVIEIGVSRKYMEIPWFHVACIWYDQGKLQFTKLSAILYQFSLLNHKSKWGGLTCF